jgi:NADH dehydrogenase
MHVAVLGAGYAGISLTRTLERSLSADVDITLVDERDTHLVQHLIHRAISHPSLEEELTVPIDDLLRRATHRQARVTDVDPDTGAVELNDGSLTYDYGAVCLGAQTAFYDLPGVEEHATPLKRLSHAARIRDRFLDVCETGGRVVVGGAGLSGIQVAGELVDFARHEGVDVTTNLEADDTDANPTASVEVRLVEQMPTVAPNFPEPFQRAVADELDSRGVHVETGRTVESTDGETLHFADDAAVDYDQFVWTGGIAGQDAMAGDRPQVRADLRLGERTFAVGDAARVVDSDGQPAPASAQTAVRQADVAAANIAKLVDHTDSGAFTPRLDRYRYSELGWLVSVGDGAVAQVGGSVVRGAAAKALKTTVGAGYLGSIGAIENASEYVWEKVGSA